MTLLRRVSFAARDFVEILLVGAYIVVVPSLVEGFMTSHGHAADGSNRIWATAPMFLGWAILAILLVRLNGEKLSEIGLYRPQRPLIAVAIGLLVAAAMLAAVMALEANGIGASRLGEMAAEIQNDPPVPVAGMALGVLVVGAVEELIFRGFIMTRLAKMIGGASPTWITALILQAILFGLAHGRQQLYGVFFTGAIGLALGIVYLSTGRNLVPVMIGHGLYGAAHAFHIGVLAHH